MTKKTRVGGLISISIFIVALFYFIYLIINWKNGNFLPKVTNILKNADISKNNQIKIDEPKIIFNVIDLMSNPVPENYFTLGGFVYE